MDQKIEKVIKACFDFESEMDSIDFNSYLSEYQEDIKIVKSKNYKNYKNKIENAKKICKVYKNKAENELRGKQMYNRILDQDNLTKYLIYHLFKAKLSRLNSRQNIERRNEVKNYLINSKRLLKAYNKIPLPATNNSTIEYGLDEDLVLLKILYNNELSICFSGLAKSSMSLGFAEESIDLLEKLCPELKNIENFKDEKIKKFRLMLKERATKPSLILSLLTSALYNKGEAERLLQKDDGAVSTFHRIVKVFKKCEEKDIDLEQTDYKMSLLKISLILIDQGRGKEAIDYLSEAEFGERDYRYLEKELEVASAFIDQKKFEEAWEILDKYNGNNWAQTFVQRKANIYILRLLNEYKENRPEDFQVVCKISNTNFLKDIPGFYFDKVKHELYMNLTLSMEDKETVCNRLAAEDKAIIEKNWKVLNPEFEISSRLKEIKNKFKEYENIAIKLIDSSIKRKDGDTFKDACFKLSEFYKNSNETVIKSLKCLYLYLFEYEMSSKLVDLNEIKNRWLRDRKLDNLLQESDNRTQLKKQLDLVRDNENYLRKFFDYYMEIDLLKLDKSNTNYHCEIIELLKSKLDQIYYHKNKDKDYEQTELKYDRFKEKMSVEIVFKEDSTVRDFVSNAFFKNKLKGLHGESIVRNMERNTLEFVKSVVGRSKNAVKQNDGLQGTLTVLRRWNSFTPVLSSTINRSKGGGYFFHFLENNESFGIVVDPGYNFLDNFFSQGFRIGDIDLVLVSHAHPDHADNLASILSLVHEMNGRLSEYYSKRKLNKKNPSLLISTGVFENYRQIIKINEKELKDVIVLDGKKEEIEFFNGRIRIKSFSTLHPDLGQSKSLGFIIKVYDKIRNKKTQIGYTGDIKWKYTEAKPPEYLKDFLRCDIVCVHLGSIINVLNGKNFCNSFCNKYPKFHHGICPNYDDCKSSNFESVDVTKNKLMEQAREENHLYLGGLILFFESLIKLHDSKLKLAIISEFGEELKNGLRKDLFLKFNDWFQIQGKNQVCLPGDIGLEIDLFDRSVYCNCCKHFVDYNTITPIPYGKEEAICYVCRECTEVLSTHQIDLKLKEYCENGRTLEPMDIIRNS